MKLLSLLALSIGLASIGLGQDSGGVADNTSGAVIKGKAPVAKEVLRVRLPKPKTFTLKNGIAVYIIEDHRTPAIRLNLQLRAGTIYEDKPGVASMTASMLTEGTANRTYDQIVETMENDGINVSANSGLDISTVSGSGLSSNTDKIISLMSDVLLHPTFPAERLNRTRNGGGGGFGGGGGRGGGGGNSPAGMISELSNHIFYGGTRYERVAPRAAERAAIKSEDLMAFYKEYFRPNGAILGVTGDVDMKSLQSKLEAAFADWMPGQGTHDLPKAEFPAKQKNHIFLIDRPGSAQTVLQFGALAVSQTHPDYIALTVANRILGGGSSGRLFQNIRERKGFTYGAYSSLAAGRFPAVWGANASVRTEVTEPATFEFFAEFKRLREQPVSEDELNRVKRSIIGGFALTLESSDGILARSIELVQNGLPATYWDTYPGLIQAVTAQDVQRVAQKYLGGSNVQLFVVGERKKIEVGLAKFGTVEIVDPTKISSVQGN
jgi:predicted Zn-dependent peptidase